MTLLVPGRGESHRLVAAFDEVEHRAAREVRHDDPEILHEMCHLLCSTTQNEQTRIWRTAPTTNEAWLWTRLGCDSRFIVCASFRISSCDGDNTKFIATDYM